MARTLARITEWRCPRCNTSLTEVPVPEQLKLHDYVPPQPSGYVEGAHRSGKNKQEDRGARVMELFDEDYCTMCD